MSIRKITILLRQVGSMGGVEKKPPLTRPPTRASEGYHNAQVGHAHHKHALPTKHLTIECRMVEQKKPPSTRRTAADGGKGHRTEKAPCQRGSLAQVKLKVEEKETPTDQATSQ